MIEIIGIEDLNKGDQILIDGDQKIDIQTIKEVLDDGLLITHESDPMDICLEDPDQVVRVGTLEEPIEMISFFPISKSERG
jgi:hypothetical protein